MIEKKSIRRSLSYSEVLKLQREPFEKKIECHKNGIPDPGDVVFFVEHNPVYTLGLHGEDSHLLFSSDDMERRGIEFFRTNRGGDITYHGPGQLTVYPIINLKKYRLGVKDYVALLEECVIRTLQEYRVKGERIEGRTGVWVGKGTENERKICAIGIKCSHFITMHGFALNVGSDLSLFGGIVPCGLSHGVTSLSCETGKEIDLDEVEEKLYGNLIALLLPRIPSQGNS